MSLLYMCELITAVTIEFIDDKTINPVTLMNFSQAKMNSELKQIDGLLNTLSHLFIDV